MTQWNDYVKEFAEKKKIAYGCAIVRNDLRKAYAKKYEPVPRNRGIYTTRNEDGTIKQMGRGNRKEAKIRSPEAVEASKLKRVATYEKKAEEKQAREKKAEEERLRKYQEEIDARLKASADKKKAEEDAKKKAEQEANEAKAKAEAKIQAEKDREKAKRDATLARIKMNQANWDTISNAKDTGGRHDGTLKKIDDLLRKNARENGITGLYLLLEKEWGADNKRRFIFSGYDLDLSRDKEEYGYLKKRDDGSVSLFLSDKAKRSSALRELMK